MGIKSWSSRLRDPRWQKKRLEVLNRASWTCEMCGDKDSTLHVHHTYYRKDADPWEYDDCHLLCVCESCHQDADAIRVELAKYVGMLHMDLQSEIHGILLELCFAQHDRKVPVEVLGMELSAAFSEMSQKIRKHFAKECA